MSQGIGGDWNVAWWIGTLGRAPVLMISIWKMCFGTWFLWLFFFRNSWEFHHPNWRTPSFFQRSRSTTNQRLILLEVLAIHLCFTEESAEEPWRAGWKEATSATFSEAVTTKFARPHRGFGVCFFHCLVVTGTWMDYDFPETVGNFITPTDELHDFSEGLVETTNQFRFRDFGTTPTT